jgi:hypothetical protein
MISKISTILGALILAAGVADGAAADTVHIYTSYASNVPPGLQFPQGPDLAVRLVLSCPGSDVSRVAITLPAGASTSSFGASSLDGPIYQDISLTLTQDFAVSPTRVAFRFTLGSVGVAGYLTPSSEFDANVPGAECSKPWHLQFTSEPLSGAYSPSTNQGLTGGMTPFPEEQ